jgi:hypothetical protein
MWTQQDVFFKGDAGTKVKTPGARKNESGDLCKLLLGEALQSPILPGPRSMPSPQQSNTRRKVNIHLPALYHHRHPKLEPSYALLHRKTSHSD